MTSTIKTTIFFTLEVLLFVLTGILIAIGSYGKAAIAFIFAGLLAGYVGKLIERNTIERYKKEELKNG